jgi:hypothetical protein
MPDRFFYIDQRHRPRAGQEMETDIYAGAGTGGLDGREQVVENARWGRTWWRICSARPRF